jgi:molybdopterin molybdotransferase
MLEVAEALAVVLEHTRPLAPRPAALDEAVGRVLAADVRADRDSPPFDKSLRDGYAVRAADCSAANPELRVVQEIAAGMVPTRPVGPGECARIYTGAPIPDGADSVVMQEDVSELGGGLILIRKQVKPEQWVFHRGAEMRGGEVVAPAGTTLNPGTIGVLASVGAAEVTAFPWPRVAVLATGDELVDATQQPGPGQIRNSNGPMLSALAEQTIAEVYDLGIARDNQGGLRRTIGDALGNADVLILAGGVSVGKFDLVPGVLEELGVVRHFHQVRMKPGKPLLFGTKDDTLVFGLPGNPVSAFVCFELFVRPAMQKLAGHADPGPRVLKLPLTAAVAETNDRPTYRPAKLELAEVGWAVRPLPWGGAPDLRGLLPADALLVLPAGEARFAPGAPCPVIALN